MPQTGKRAIHGATAFVADLTDDVYQNKPTAQQEALNQSNSAERGDGKTGLVSTEKFFKDTINVSMKQTYEKFLPRIKPRGKLLDLQQIISVNFKFLPNLITLLNLFLPSPTIEIIYI